MGLCLVVGAMSSLWGFGLVGGLLACPLEGGLRLPYFLMSLLVGALSCSWGFVFSLGLWPCSRVCGLVFLKVAFGRLLFQ